MNTLRITAGIVLMALGSLAAHADTLLVPAEYPTIQDAVDAASLNDIILVSPGVYEEDVLLYNLDKPMSLVGTGAVPGDTVITGRVQAENGEIENLRMTGLVELGSGEIAVTDCEIVGSGVNVELALAVFFENTTFTDFQFSNVHVTLSQVTFLNCSFQNNNDVDHPRTALVIQDSVATIVGCTFENNTGGVIGTAFAATLDISDSLFLNNHAASNRVAGVQASGTGVRCNLYGCTFDGNTSEQEYSSVVSIGDGDTSASPGSISLCSFTNNTLGPNGAAVRLFSDQEAPVSIQETSFCSNLPADVFAPFHDGGGNTFALFCCPADTNRDGALTPTDFTAWINAFNNNLPECDQNGDGSCTPTDFTAWIANYNAGC